MSQPSLAAEHTAAAVTAAFQRIHDTSFRGEAVENELLEVEVLYAGELRMPLGRRLCSCSSPLGP